LRRRAAEILFVGCFETGTAERTGPITSYDYRLVVQTVSATNAAWIDDVVIFAGMKQPALFGASRVVVGAIDLTLAGWRWRVNDRAKAPLRFRVVNFLEGLPGYEVRIEVARGVRSVHGDLAGIVDSPGDRIGAALHVKSRVLRTDFRKTMRRASRVEVQTYHFTLVVDSGSLRSAGFRELDAGKFPGGVNKGNVNAAAVGAPARSRTLGVYAVERDPAGACNGLATFIIYRG